MPAYLIVRAEVDPSVKDAFDAWYEKEHLPDALKAFNALSAKRGWSSVEANVHIAFYEFSDLVAANTLINSDILKGFNLQCNGFDLDYELCAKLSKIKIRTGEKKIKYFSRSFKEGRKTLFSKNNIYVDGLKGLFVILKEKFY